MLRLVRSRNWSGSTMSHGRYRAWSEPTALTPRIHATPSFFIAHTLARWFSSLGRILWPRPFLGRKTTSPPASRPASNWSLVGSKGVLTVIHFWFVNPSMWYSPLPPMMPMRWFAIRCGAVVRGDGAFGERNLLLWRAHWVVGVVALRPLRPRRAGGPSHNQPLGNSNLGWLLGRCGPWRLTECLIAGGRGP